MAEVGPPCKSMIRNQAFFIQHAAVTSAKEDYVGILTLLFDLTLVLKYAQKADNAASETETVMRLLENCITSLDCLLKLRWF